MAKALKLNADEVDYLLKKLANAKFGLDDDETRIMVYDLREKLQGVKTGTEPMFPQKPEAGDDDSGTD